MLSPEYWLLLLLLIWGLFLHKKKWCVIPSIVLMAFLIFMRDITVGTDLMGYEEDFNIITSIADSDNIRHHFEYGFMYAITVFKRYSNDYLLFIAIFVITGFLGVLKFIKSNSVDFAFALFVYYTMGFYFMTFNIMRQMVVVSLCMMFIPFLYQKKYILYSCCVIIISFLFHRSGLLLILLIPLHYLTEKNEHPIHKKFLYCALIISMLVFYIDNENLKAFFTYITELVFNETYYINYITYEQEEYGNTTSIIYTLFALMLVYLKNPTNYRFQTYTYVLSIVLYNIFNTFSTYGTRVSFPFMFISILLFPQMIFDEQTKYRKTWTIVVFFFCIGVFFYKYLFNNSGLVNPYIYRDF